MDRPGAAQTELRLGHVGVPRTHPDYIPLLVLNTLLGGKFTSRINLNLRERHGYTYGASSRFSARQGPGPFTVNAAVETESAGAAAREVLHELRRVREALVEPEELDGDPQLHRRGLPLQPADHRRRRQRLETLAVFGLPDDYYTHYLRKIAAVTREEIQEVARRHLDPEHIVVVAVGPAEDLEPQFEGRGAGDRLVARGGAPGRPAAPALVELDRRAASGRPDGFERLRAAALEAAGDRLDLGLAAPRARHGRGNRPARRDRLVRLRRRAPACASGRPPPRGAEKFSRRISWPFAQMISDPSGSSDRKWTCTVAVVASGP